MAVYKISSITFAQCYTQLKQISIILNQQFSISYDSALCIHHTVSMMYYSKGSAVSDVSFLHSTSLIVVDMKKTV